ncbi:uncharacterized protein LOC131221373 [Magnolia sinica]|uniref:uncharacterized protein LOC131221373 n=1 Tax=Magnolia sinica TaxID=86752 RepID=UPI00265A1E0E|nr:uncharacterized protein LOC131221373 [Magnolia sinica]
MEMGVVGFVANKSTCVGMLNGCANMGSMCFFQATPHTSDVYEMVALLFKEHQNLLEEFVSFLPNPIRVDLMQHALVERSLAMPMVQQVHGEEGAAACLEELLILAAACLDVHGDDSVKYL